MEKIIQQNNDEITMKYIGVTLFSLLTLRKLTRVEKLRKELKDLKEQQGVPSDLCGFTTLSEIMSPNIDLGTINPIDS